MCRSRMQRSAVLWILAAGATWTPAAAQPPGQQPPKPVEVVNEPVVHAQQSGPWTVGLSGEVAISAGETLDVRDAEAPARHAFQTELIFSVSPGQQYDLGAFTVPAGRRLVIEQVTVDGFTAPAGRLLASVKTSVGGALAQHNLVMQEQGTFNGAAFLVASQRVRLYADPGTDVEVYILQSDPGGSVIDATVSGYLVECGGGPGCPSP